MSDAPSPGRPPLPVLELIDRIGDEFEQAWRRGERPRAEDFLARIEETYRPALAAELLAAEVEARRRLGEHPTREEYARRFPDLADAVDRLFAGAPAAGPGDAPTALLYGLLGYQTGLIGRGSLIDALRAWGADGSKPPGEALTGAADLDDSHRRLLEALVAEHLRRHDGDVTRSLAALPAGKSTIEELRRLGDPGIDATLAQAGVDAATTRADGEDPGGGPASRPGGSRDGQRYRVLRFHARGGLGAVFVARDEELNREVALKEIQDRHADDPTSRSRFLAEAEITGGLEHPGIVPVYGLGSYGDGRPYYAMRFVRGDSLREAIERFHADESLRADPGRRSLGLRKLLRRFLDVCNAIDYAHSRGVLHRDLKPGNVIVGKHGETLVIDWGLAKALGAAEPGVAADEQPLSPSSASGSARTLPGSVQGTPAYMSPEQARGELDRLGVRSDVYSLGATLYCLLTGRPPFEGDDLVALLQAVERGAFRPPRQLDPSIDRPLEAICRKAMALEPTDRYASCRALADDLERWLADEPVAAWKEPWTRTLVRWLTRHRTGVTAAGAGLAAGLVGLAAVVAVQARANANLREAKSATDRALAQTLVEKKAKEDALTQSEASRVQAEAVNSFLVEAFRSPDPDRDGRQVKVAELLDRAVSGLRKQFAQDDVTRAALLNALGQTYQGLGLPADAVRLLEEARNLREKRLGVDHPETLTTCGELVVLYSAAGRYQDAIALGEQTVRRSTDRLGARHPGTLHKRNQLGVALGEAGQLARALALDEETLKLRLEVLGPDHPDTLESRNNLGDDLRQAGRFQEAADLHALNVRAREKTLGQTHPSTLTSYNNLAEVYQDLGRYDEAIRLNRETLRVRRAVLGPDHPHTLATLNNLATDYQESGRHDEAARLLDESDRLRTAKFGETHPGTLIGRNNLALAYNLAGRFDDAIRIDERTLAIRRKVLGPTHQLTLASQSNLAYDYFDGGRFARAIAMGRENAEQSRRILTADHPDTLRSLNNLAVMFLVTGRVLEAIAIDESVLARRERVLGPDHPRTLASRFNLAADYEALGDWDRAESLRRDALARARRTTSADSPILAGYVLKLGRHLLKRGRWAEAAALLKEAAGTLRRMRPDHWRTFEATSMLGEALGHLGQYAEAEPAVVAGYEGMNARRATVPVHSRRQIEDAAERVIHLYEAWGKPARAAAWKLRLGLEDLPGEVFAGFTSR